MGRTRDHYNTQKRHIKVIEAFDKLQREYGELSAKLPKSFFTDKVGEMENYDPRTVAKIVNNRKAYESK